MRFERHHAACPADDAAGEHGEIAHVGADIQEHVTRLQDVAHRSRQSRLVRFVMEVVEPAGAVTDVDIHVDAGDGQAAVAAPGLPQTVDEVILGEPVQRPEQV